jgi:hypothetical protein
MTYPFANPDTGLERMINYAAETAVDVATASLNTALHVVLRNPLPIKESGLYFDTPLGGEANCVAGVGKKQMIRVRVYFERGNPEGRERRHVDCLIRFEDEGEAERTAPGKDAAVNAQPSTNKIVIEQYYDMGGGLMSGKLTRRAALSLHGNSAGIEISRGYIDSLEKIAEKEVSESVEALSAEMVAPILPILDTKHVADIDLHGNPILDMKEVGATVLRLAEGIVSEKVAAKEAMRDKSLVPSKVS